MIKGRVKQGGCQEYFLREGRQDFMIREGLWVRKNDHIMIVRLSLIRNNLSGMSFFKEES